ncbi:uncharacterized protein LOC127102758 [Lathyrus oleraceus]|uniref:uncharacterized protein LOC127102758 n=1 Tax=Pisum sativum TaxID=3888 RepID=UPI0021CE87A4|nr:uncharacterized protein LOC127102758 [Pisum sativum]
MRGLDTDTVEHHFLLKSECPPVKQKLRRTRPYMALKIKEEVQKQIDVGFLVTTEYPQWLSDIVPVPKKNEYDIEYHTHKAIKGSILADHLAHHTINDYQSIQFDFHDEDVMYLKAKDYDEPLPGEGPDPKSRWGLIFDGVVNAYGYGIGEVIGTPQGSHIPFTARFTFTCTNNVAEYDVCIIDLKEVTDLRIKIMDVYGDSTLVIN